MSYNRPLGNHGLENEFWYAEYPLVRWLERNGYDVSYFADIDSHQRPAELLKHKVFISSGHDEYWSKAQRANVEAARDAGVNLIFMTGNEVFWKVRWEPGADGTPDRTMVCYKETLANAKIDPHPEWTGTWRDKRFTPPSDGGRPENGLTGTLFRAINPNNDPDFSIRVPYEYSRLRIWRNTSVASLPVGGSATFPLGTLGYEWNTDEDNGARPAGLIRMSQTTETAAQVLVDNGGTYVSSPLTHYITMYRAASGARVFSMGTVQWSWGLDETHQNAPSVPVPTSTDMQQATLNVLADMGAQPVTRQSGLVAATASTDSLPPAAVITSPANGGSVTIGSPITVTGTASDSGGGRVAAVEVSVDGGTTWHPATGTTGWSYTFTAAALGPIEVRARAIDDSCNIQTAVASVSLTGTPRPLPASLWSASAVPAVASANDTSAVELGVKFRVDTDGFVSGIRFYKGAGNTGTHTGRLWTSTGTELASVTFTGETATGWQQALFQRPVPVVAGTTYVASYFAPVGRYAADVGYFSSTYNLPPLRPLANGEDGPNGVFRGGSTGFPTDTYGATNYWVDVVFDTDDHLAPTVVDRTPAPDLESVAASSVVRATFSEAMNASTIQIQVAGPDTQPLAGTTGYDVATRTVTFTPAAALAPATRYTATVSSARDVSGQSISGPVSWSFTTAGGANATSVSLWDTSAVPAVASVNDANAVEVGMKFTSDIGGSVRSIRFYKGSANSGTHIGHLWDAAGALLGTATFANESATGWQQANLVAPVTITAGATYVISVYMPNGGYAATSGGFGASVDRAPLHGLRSASSGGNGVFRYGIGGGFPTGSYGDPNYWVDLMFDRPADSTAPTLVNREPAPNLQGVAATTAVVATFSEPIDGSSLAFSLKGPGGTAVPATVTYDGPTRTARLTPNSALAAGALYSASVSAKDSVGNPMPAPDTWGFATAVPVGQTPATIWDTSAVPAVISANDTAAVELGVKFRSDVDGAISGLRFFKGLGNEGPHVGRLWTADGVLLGQVSFTDETATGWQQPTSPVRCPSPPTPRTWPPTTPRRVGTPTPAAGSPLRWTGPRSTACPTPRPAETASTPTAPEASRPARSARPTTGSTWCSWTPAAPTSSPGPRNPAPPTRRRRRRSPRPSTSRSAAAW